MWTKNKDNSALNTQIEHLEAEIRRLQKENLELSGKAEVVGNFPHLIKMLNEAARLKISIVTSFYDNNDWIVRAKDTYSNQRFPQMEATERTHTLTCAYAYVIEAAIQHMRLDAVQRLKELDNE